MTKGILVRVVLGVAALMTLGWLPQVALAQHGGGHGGGGGGFHGGGGGGGFHGGGGFSGGGHSGFSGGRSYGGAYHGGYNGGRGFYGGRGGYGRGGRGYGWGGRGWGYGWGRGGWGWGWGYGFGWPYWGYGWGYPYGYYGYSPWYYSYPYSYSYPSDGTSEDYIGDYPPDPPDYDDGRSYNHRRVPNNGPNANPRPPYSNGNRAPAADPNAQPQTDPANPTGSARSWRPSAPDGAASVNYNRGTAENFLPRPRVLSVEPMTATETSYRPARSDANRDRSGRAALQTDALLRPDMQRALERLRNMPPFAREREIEAGRYRQFSAEDKHILRNGQ